MIRKLKSLLDIKMLRSAAALTAGRFYSLGVIIALSLVQARFIGPEITGFCSAFNIPVGYLWILTLGVPSAIQRELPYLLARGERENALLLTQTAQSYSIVMGGLCGAAFAILSARSCLRGDYLSAAGWAFQIIAAFLAIYNSYINTLYRTNDEFIKYGKSKFISATSSIAAFPLIFWNPYLGIWIKNAVDAISGNIYLYINRPFKLKFGFNFARLQELANFGIPLIIIGYIEVALWGSTQAALIYKMGGATVLGLFNFINSILGALLVIPNSVADILRPKFAAVYGQTSGDFGKSLQVAYKPLALALIVSAIAVLFSWLFLDDIIVWLLPKYAAAIPAIGIALITIPVMTVHSVKYMFVVCKNMRFNFFSTAPGFVVAISLLYYFLKQGMSFKFIFLPYLSGQMVNLVITLFLLRFMTRNNEIGISV